MSASEASSFEKILIESNDQERSVDLRGGIVSIDYYEDILSPTITAKMRVIDTGNTSIDKKDTTRRGLYSGLPLRGGERIEIKIKDQGKANAEGKEKLGLDFSSDKKVSLYVSSVTQVLMETQRESFLLNLVSREAITNETSRVYKRYDNIISETVKKILTDPLIGLNVDKSKLNDIVEPTKGTYNFLGNLRKPFSVLISLASKSIPNKSGGATAGYVFFQTQDGFQFKSIDKLISEKPKATYIYKETNDSSITENNDLSKKVGKVNENWKPGDNLNTATMDYLKESFEKGELSAEDYKAALKQASEQGLDGYEEYVIEDEIKEVNKEEVKKEKKKEKKTYIVRGTNLRFDNRDKAVRWILNHIETKRKPQYEKSVNRESGVDIDTQSRYEKWLFIRFAPYVELVKADQQSITSDELRRIDKKYTDFKKINPYATP